MFMIMNFMWLWPYGHFRKQDFLSVSVCTITWAIIISLFRKYLACVDTAVMSAGFASFCLLEVVPSFRVYFLSKTQRQVYIMKKDQQFQRKI